MAPGQHQWQRIDMYKLPLIAEGTLVAASMSVARPNGSKVQMSGDAEAYRKGVGNK